MICSSIASCASSSGPFLKARNQFTLDQLNGATSIRVESVRFSVSMHGNPASEVSNGIGSWSIKHVICGSPLPKLNPRLAKLERVFRSPPMTRELVGPIRLISPHLDFRPNEASDRLRSRQNFLEPPSVGIRTCRSPRPQERHSQSPVSFCPY